MADKLDLLRLVLPGLLGFLAFGILFPIVGDSYWLWLSLIGVIIGFVLQYRL